MAVFYVDEAFPEHPKAIAAGDDACWLYICGLAYIRRNDTPGTIPKPVAPRLVARKGGTLARQLVKVGLWHDDGDLYRVHDYEEFNARSIAKREQAREAAKKRWAKPRGTPDADTDTIRSDMRTHSGRTIETDADAHADASVSQCPIEPVIQRTKEPAAAAATTSGGSGVFEQAVEILTTAQLARVPSKGPRHIHAKAVRAGKLKDHADEAARALADYPDMTAQQLADWLEPASTPRQALAVDTSPTSGGDKTRAADEARMARSVQEPCPTCGTRGGYGWVETDEGEAARCPTCTPARSHT